MKYKEECECCGHVATAYTLPLNKSLTNAFIKFVEKYQKTGRGLSKGEIGLTNSQYSNFQNLRHFGIIQQAGKGNKWFPTRKGMQFFYGEIGLYTPAGHIGGNTLPDNHRAWDTHDRDRELKYIHEVEETHYKRRPEYQQEKSNQYQLI